MSGSHHIRKADARNCRVVGLAGAGIADSRCLRCAQPNFKPEDGGQKHRQHDVSDSYNVPRRSVYFHGSTVVLQRLKALIEKSYLFIDANDGCRCQHCAEVGQTNVWATGTTAAPW